MSWAPASLGVHAVLHSLCPWTEALLPAYRRLQTDSHCQLGQRSPKPRSIRRQAYIRRDPIYECQTRTREIAAVLSRLYLEPLCLLASEICPDNAHSPAVMFSPSHLLAIQNQIGRTSTRTQQLATTIRSVKWACAGSRDCHAPRTLAAHICVRALGATLLAGGLCTRKYARHPRCAMSYSQSSPVEPGPEHLQ